jgi:hypothetical protein
LPPAKISFTALVEIGIHDVTAFLCDISQRVAWSEYSRGPAIRKGVNPSKMAPRPLADVGAGLSTKSSTIDPHPAGPVQHGKTGQVERAFTAASTFFSGMMA